MIGSRVAHCVMIRKALWIGRRSAAGFQLQDVRLPAVLVPRVPSAELGAVPVPVVPSTVVLHGRARRKSLSRSARTTTDHVCVPIISSPCHAVVVFAPGTPTRRAGNQAEDQQTTSLFAQQNGLSVLDCARASRNQRPRPPLPLDHVFVD